ncbi:hypothetical protein ACNOYE_11920 [Nannocystaceae bacterium ST9]
MIAWIDWSDHQRSQVESTLASHPVLSNRCAQAALGILPTAREVDEEAHGLVIQPPLGALYVQPKGLAARWYHHVTVAVSEHCVDVLPGVDGHARTSYLATYFDYPEEHIMRPIESSEWEEL